MVVERFYLNCLSHASYLVISGGEAAVIDPQRDVDSYLEYLDANRLSLRYVIETHLHADFVSGHLELARRTGAEIVIGHRADARFPHHPARDGEELRLGTATLRIIETPGHTPEGITVAVTDTAAPDEPAAQLLSAADVGWIDTAERRTLVEGISLKKLSYSPLWVEMTRAMSRGRPLTRRQGRLIDNRRWPSATPGPVQMPSPSGPRWAIASHIRFTRAGSTGLGVPQWNIPAIPHIGAA